MIFASSIAIWLSYPFSKVRAPRVRGLRPRAASLRGRSRRKSSAASCTKCFSRRFPIVPIAPLGWQHWGLGQRRISPWIARDAARQRRPWPRGRRRSDALRSYFEGRLDTPEIAQAVAEGLMLADFDGGRYKTVDYEPTPITALTVVTRHSPEAAEARRRARARAG